MIQAGDLVVVAKPSNCCGGQDGIGHIFIVIEVISERQCSHCAYCGHHHSSNDGQYATDGAYAWPFARLRRIPPLTKLRHAEEHEKADV